MTNSELKEHMKRAAEIVSKWPEWKQKVLRSYGEHTDKKC